MPEDLSHYLNPQTYRNTRLATEDAITLPPALYREQNIFSLELEKVFGHAWACVGYTCQVDQPGKMLTTTVAGQPVVITRNKQGVLRGFYNVCRHRGSTLVTKPDQVERFRCPYHSWTYDLDGNLQNCPLFLNQENPAKFVKENYHLLPIRVDSWGSFIFVNLDPAADNLSDYLGDLPHSYKNFPLNELILVKRKEYSIKANWKLIAENFLEYYHLPWVHPELCQVSAVDLHKRNQGAGMYMSFYASPLLKGNTPLDADYLKAMPRLNDIESQSGYFPFVFPNLAMFLLPHHVFCLLMQPTSVDHTQEYGDILVHPSLFNEPQFEKKLEAIFQFYDMVNIQDIVAVERVQQGIQCKSYPGGRMNYRFEEPVHRFQNMVIDYLTGSKQNYRGDS